MIDTTPSIKLMCSSYAMYVVTHKLADNEHPQSNIDNVTAVLARTCECTGDVIDG